MRLALVCAAVIAAGVLSGCSPFGGGDDAELPKLLRFKNTGRPDDLSTVTTNPLVFPDLNVGLKAPASSGKNLADRDASNEVIRTLGGTTPEKAAAPPARDRRLVAYATRYGYDPQIREKLEAADLEYRRRHDGRLLERVFKVNVYHRAYEPLALDPYAELTRLRQANIRTPAAPPNPAGN